MMMRHPYAVYAGILLAVLAQMAGADVMMPAPDWNADPVRAGVKSRWDSLVFDRDSTNAVIPLAPPGLGYAHRPDLWPLAYPEDSWGLVLRDTEPAAANRGWDVGQESFFARGRWLSQVSGRGLMRRGGARLSPPEVYRGLNEGAAGPAAMAASRVLFWLMPLLLLALVLFVYRRRFNAPQ